MIKKKYIANIALIFISLFLSFTLFEYFLIKNNEFQSYNQFYQKINNVNYRFNDDPKKYFNDENQEKIIFLGDSFTMGEVCAANKKDFVNVVKSQMGENCKSGIYNFASVALGPPDFLNIYNYFKQKNLKKVIVVLNYNDIAINLWDCMVLKELANKKYYPEVKMCKSILETKRDRYRGGLIKIIDNFLEKTNTWKFVRSKLYVFPFLRKYYGSSTIEDFYENQKSIEFTTYLDVLKKMQIDAKKNKIGINFVYFPDVIYLRKDNDKHWKFFINVAKTKGVIIKDAWEYFLQNKNSDNMSWSLIDYHPNCKAHGIMANFITEKIL